MAENACNAAPVIFTEFKWITHCGEQSQVKWDWSTYGSELNPPWFSFVESISSFKISRRWCVKCDVQNAGQVATQDLLVPETTCLSWITRMKIKISINTQRGLLLLPAIAERAKLEIKQRGPYKPEERGRRDRAWISTVLYRAGKVFWDLHFKGANTSLVIHMYELGHQTSPHKHVACASKVASRSNWAAEKKIETEEKV